MSNPSRKQAGAKPYPSYPLTPHRHAKQWCKKIQGKVYYFGPLSDPQKALDRYLHDKDFLLAGHTPPAIGDGNGLTLSEMVNLFLTSAHRKVGSGEIQPVTFANYRDAGRLMVNCLGRTRCVEDLRPHDFARLRSSLGKGASLVTLANRVCRLRAIFNWACTNDLVVKVHWGSEFRRPPAKSLRVARAAKSPRLFSATEIRGLLAAADTPNLKAMVLLGINAALGNTDISSLPISGVDLCGGWLDYPRIKTGIPRRCPLWPETVAAIKEALAHRKEATDPADADLLFLTHQGRRYIRFAPKGDKHVAVDGIGQELTKLVKELGIARAGLGYYSLRHSFRTVADQVGDQRAAMYIMGHVMTDIGAIYTHHIEDSRLRRVVQHVHDWLFPKDHESDVGEEA